MAATKKLCKRDRDLIHVVFGSLDQVPLDSDPYANINSVNDVREVELKNFRSKLEKACTPKKKKSS